MPPAKLFENDKVVNPVIAGEPIQVELRNGVLVISDRMASKTTTAAWST